MDSSELTNEFNIVNIQDEMDTNNDDFNATDHYRKIGYGILIVILIGVSWTGSTQFAQTVVTDSSFNAPFFVMWLSTSFKIFCAIPVFVNKCKTDDATKILETQRNPVDPFTKLSSLRYIVLYLLWTGANYSYIRALNSISATLVTALFSSAPAFVYVFSVLLLKLNVSILKIVAVLLCISGILLITLSNLDESVELLGCLLSILSAICAAFYKVLFKKFYGDMSIWRVCQFLSYLGLFNLCFSWSIVLLLDFTNAEPLPKEYPWFFLFGSSVLGLLFDFSINFGIAFSYPLFISIGTILGIPLNFILDLIIHGTHFGLLPSLGCIVIISSFLTLITSDYIIVKRMKYTRQSDLQK